MKKFLNFIFIIIMLSSCRVQHSTMHTINNFDWLKGSWTQETGNSKLVETWDTNTDTELHGKSYFIRNKDTVYTESLKIKIDKEAIYYSAAVSNQNNGNPIKFKLINNLIADTLIFENKNHDFPQRICYIKPKNNTLKTFIDGTNKGVYKKVDFLFTK